MSADENGFLGRHFRDDDMHARIIAVVEKALATAGPARVFHDEVGGHSRTYCSFVRRHDPDMFGRRTSIYLGVAYELVLYAFDGEREDAEARTNLAALVRDPELSGGPFVSWQWGSGSPDESSAAEYLTWWENIVEHSVTGQGV